MIANSAVRNSIREGKTQYLQNAMQLGLKEKMQTLNQALAKLALLQKHRGVIVGQSAQI